MPALQIKACPELGRRDPALEMALYCYSLGAYPVLDKLSAREIREVSEAVLEFTSEVEPYRVQESGKFPERDIPHFGQVTIIKAYAITAAIVVKRQWEIEGPEELVDKNSVLAPCVEAYKMHRPVAQGRLCL